MKLSYKIHIHRHPDNKKKKNQIMLITSWKPDKSKYHETQIEYCCDEMKQAVDRGYIIVATNKQNFNHIKYEERKKPLQEPLICLRTFDEMSGWNRDESPEEFNLPISHCPFCTENIKIECVEKKLITHTCKKVTKKYESCEDQTREEILKIPKSN